MNIGFRLLLIPIVLILTGCQWASMIVSKSSDLDVSPRSKILTTGQSLTFTIQGGRKPYQYTLLQGSGQIDPVTGIFISGNSPEVVRVEISDSNGQTSIATIEVVPPLSNSNYEVYSGDDLSFLLPTPAGGVPEYDYELISGVGQLMNSNFTPGLVSGLTSIRVTDQAGGEAILSLKIREWVQTATVGSNSSVVSSALYFHEGVDLNGEHLVMSYLGIPEAYSTNFFGPTKKFGPSFFKTSDDGASWTYVSTFFYPSNKAATGRKLLKKNATTLYQVGIANPNTGYSEAYIAESTDSGLTWSVKEVYQPDSPYDSAWVDDAVLSQNNTILLAGRGQGGNGDHVFIRSCDLSTWTCENVHESIEENTSRKNEIGALDIDAAGNLYALHLKWVELESGASHSVVLKKSSDHGQTWTDTIVTNNGVNARLMDVSADGQTIVLAGTQWVSPGISLHSYDGGATWTYLWNTAVCPSGSRSVTDVRINNVTRDIIGTCYRWTGGVYTQWIIRLPYQAANWSTLRTIGGISDSIMSERENGTLLFSLGNLSVSSSNFGNSFVGITSPSRSFVSDADFWDLAQADSTTLYTSGLRGTSVSLEKRGIIYRSADSGDSWSLDYVDGSDSFISSVTVSPTTQTRIAVGRRDTDKWVTYRKLPAGAWAASDIQTLTAYATPNKVFSGANGHIVAVGSYGFFNTNWYVKRSIDDGVTWQILDDYKYNGTGATSANGGLVDGSDIWVIGSGTDAGSLSHWLVRKYDGTTWTIEDDFSMPSDVGLYLKPVNILKASDGTLYVVGEYTVPGNLKKWIVRQKNTEGTWETVDLFQPSPSENAAALAISQDSNGRIFVSGLIESNGILKSGIRALMNGTWQTINLDGSNGVNSPKAMIPCLINQICIAGGHTDADGMFRGVFRKLSP